MDLTFFEKFNIPREVVTLDIETEATTPDAVICTIGAVIINIVTGEERAEFYTRCITQTQVDQLGRVTDEETQAFWLKQSEENPTAFDEAFDHSLLRFELKAALEAFKDWYHQNFTAGQRPAVFANGPEFDCVIVAHAYKQLLLELPWDHGCNQSVRTMVWMGRVILGIDPKKELHFEGDRHDALADARHEAQQIHHIFKAFLQLKERLHWLTATAVIPAPADISESELVELAIEPGTILAIPQDPQPWVYWQSPDVVPEVAKGEAETFWIAVKYLRKGEWQTTVFDAQYVNKPIEFAPDDTELEYPLDDDHFVDGNGDPVAALGWHSLLNHPEFSSYYEGISFNDEYVLLGWAKYCKPAFTGLLGG